jgi:hypothetical protein
LIHSPVGEPGGRDDDSRAGDQAVPVGACDHDAAGQEPWDHERFLETYNRIAKARGGWRFEANGRTPEELRRRYQRYPQDTPTIESFAEGLFMWDQMYSL